MVAVLLIAGVLVAVLAGGSDDDSADGGPEVIVGGRDTGSTTGGQVGTDPDKSIKEGAPDATSELAIVGPSNGAENAVISAAIVDIQSFWTDEMPDAYGAEYQPVEGGFYSWSPDEELPPCVDSPDNISGNAFYCGQADVVAWDDTDLIPHLYETYGDLSVGNELFGAFGRDFLCADGERVMIVGLTGKQWRAICDALRALAAGSRFPDILFAPVFGKSRSAMALAAACAFATPFVFASDRKSVV